MLAVRLDQGGPPDFSKEITVADWRGSIKRPNFGWQDLLSNAITFIFYLELISAKSLYLSSLAVIATLKALFIAMYQLLLAIAREANAVGLAYFALFVKLVSSFGKHLKSWLSDSFQYSVAHTTDPLPQLRLHLLNPQTPLASLLDSNNNW